MSRDTVRRGVVSIVIPCFNHRRFVDAAIDSALAQRWPACEVIVVDDGSTDGSGEVIARYSGLTVVRQANSGLSAARNAGLHASRGEFVIFLDADDRLWPDAAGIAVAALTANPEAMMTFGRCRLVDAAGLPLTTNARPVRSNFYEELLRGNYIWMPAMAAFRRQVFAEAGEFDRRFNPAADYDLYCRITRRWPVTAHELVVADYRQHAGNMSADPVLMIRSTMLVLRAQWPHVAGNPALAAAYAEGMDNWRVFYGERLVERFRSKLRARRLLSAAADAVRLLKWHPRGVRYHLLKKLRLMLRRASPPNADDSVNDLAGL